MVSEVAARWDVESGAPSSFLGALETRCLGAALVGDGEVAAGQEVRRVGPEEEVALPRPAIERLRPLGGERREAL